MSLHPTDTITIQAFKLMKIVKENAQWEAQTKGFDADSGLLTLPFERDEEEGGDDHNDDVP